MTIPVEIMKVESNYADFNGTLPFEWKGTVYAWNHSPIYGYTGFIVSVWPEGETGYDPPQRISKYYMVPLNAVTEIPFSYTVTAAGRYWVVLKLKHDGAMVEEVVDTSDVFDFTKVEVPTPAPTPTPLTPAPAPTPTPTPPPPPPPKPSLLPWLVMGGLAVAAVAAAAAAKKKR
jgi:hypothetical protein